MKAYPSKRNRAIVPVINNALGSPGPHYRTKYYGVIRVVGLRLQWEEYHD